jgi:hypothetical protein
MTTGFFTVVFNWLKHAVALTSLELLPLQMWRSPDISKFRKLLSFMLSRYYYRLHWQILKNTKK